ncbi:MULTISPECIES: dihydrolipoyllysine-residue succinyltransferase [Staphylococcus]|jgi:2-oxoglutarate dehydrogenase E2 component (dihydrolipoamide succinyltransferase)|uniref:Dihydrolipoyllysine-residue succinyltransferase component of 2-oxoglutarate dehydrogenase complex n=1 Tax=Staphylococcus nepalensis TaxID=214473 RepID=A0A291JJN7_9STAP|nr:MULTISPECIES: dihydrolipoyllysine-residue succinyltransferase [Staphylococcus]VDG67112.1 PdhC [Lacrimispora indolis]ATH60101.1 dihydrolipoamide succinyltransferase [Staphylococcus nepalensis]ATH65192.1 dihydrolipoamide succinyltransferase [Staphylococcus nepalensis]AWI44559.1 dihydrolipoamide succinyltransferase [Staphylococcus nepalensis]MBO1220762.1 dihydrolipoyllysine-residue succinyltransferase [Staphylococcus nepalensis]
MPEVKVPELAESITEGTIAEWLKQVGDSVDKGEAILELETDKVNVEVVSEEAGVLQELLANEGDTVEVGQSIAVVGEGSGNNAPETSKQDDSEKQSSASSNENEANQTKSEPQNDSASDNAQDKGARVNATPSARKYAREKGIDLSEVATQSNDIVRKEHVNQTQNNQSNSQQTAQSSTKEEPKKTAAQQNPTKPVIREKMSRRKKTAAKKLLEVSNNTAMLTTFNEIDMTNVMNLRKRKKEQFIKDHDGTKLGFMSFFTKAAVAALKKYPEVNAEIDGEDMITKQFYDIGVAVSTEDGLLVPFVRDCDKKNFAEIEDEIANLATKARDKKLGLDDMVNGSFTITNGGIFGSMMSTPIINGSQAAILGMHSIITRPIAIDADTIENRPMMYIALSYDHRIIDGKEAVGFLKTIKELIENPEDLLLES